MNINLHTFYSDALLSDTLSVRKIRRDLKQLQKTDPIPPPALSAEEGLAEWYANQGITVAPLSRRRQSRRRLFFGGAVCTAAFLFILFILPRSIKNSFTKNENMEMGSSSSAEAVAEDTFEGGGTTDGEMKASESAPEESQQITEDAADTAVILEQVIQNAYENGKELYFTATALMTQNQPGYLLLEQDIRIAVTNDFNVDTLAGKTLTITCEANRYQLKDSLLLPEDGALTITIQE